MSKLKLPRENKFKNSIWVILVTAVFLVIGIILTVIAYRDTIITWMATTGIAFIVLAIIPIGAYIFNLINKKIDS